MGIDVITLALAKKYADSKITGAASGSVTAEQLSNAISSYFNKNPNLIVTNDELESVLEDYQAEIVAGKNITIDSDKKTINANFTLTNEEKQNIADLHKDKVSSVNGKTGDVTIDIDSLITQINSLQNQITILQESMALDDLVIIKAQSESENAADIITNLEEGQAVKLTANQTISEDITIEKNCYIDANGSTFTGTITVPADADVTIKNATFSNPVVII